MQGSTPLSRRSTCGPTTICFPCTSAACQPLDLSRSQCPAPALNLGSKAKEMGRLLFLFRNQITPTVLTWSQHPGYMMVVSLVRFALRAKLEKPSFHALWRIQPCRFKVEGNLSIAGLCHDICAQWPHFSIRSHITCNGCRKFWRQRGAS